MKGHYVWNIQYHIIDITHTLTHKHFHNSIFERNWKFYSFSFSLFRGTVSTPTVEQAVHRPMYEYKCNFMYFTELSLIILEHVQQYTLIFNLIYVTIFNYCPRHVYPYDGNGTYNIPTIMFGKVAWHEYIRFTFHAPHHKDKRWQFKTTKAYSPLPFPIVGFEPRSRQRSLMNKQFYFLPLFSFSNTYRWYLGLIFHFCVNHMSIFSFFFFFIRRMNETQFVINGISIF